MEKNSPPERRVITLGCPELAEAALLVSPQVAVGGGVLFIEMSGSHQLRSLESSIARLRVLARKMGKSELPWAQAKTASWARARLLYPSNDPLKLPLEALSCFADPFSLEPSDSVVTKELKKFTHALTLLGFKEIGELKKLPARSLVSRFGISALRIHERLFCNAEPPWPRFHLPEKIIETTPESEEGEGFDLESVVFILKGLLDRLLVRLQARRLKLASLKLTFSERGGGRALVIQFPVPQSTVTGILPILRDRLSVEFQRRPFKEGLNKVTAEVLESVPGRGSQRNLFNKKEEDSEKREELMARLVEKFGKDKVYGACLCERHRPEAAYQRVSVAVLKTPTSSVALVESSRPSRLLLRPELLHKMGNFLMTGAGQRWAVQDWGQPERLSGEWWESGFDRDYYRVLTDEGRLLWIFKDRASGELKFYLQGYFD